MSTKGALDRSRRFPNPNQILISIFAAVLLLTASVVLFTSKRESKTWNIKSPQGVVQTYLKAMSSGNTDKAQKFLSRESKCTVSDLDRAFMSQEARVYLSDARVSKNTASVFVKVEMPSGGPLNNNYSELHTLRLGRTNGSWLLIGIPWPLYDCGVIQK